MDYRSSKSVKVHIICNDIVPLQVMLMVKKGKQVIITFRTLEIHLKSLCFMQSIADTLMKLVFFMLMGGDENQLKHLCLSNLIVSQLWRSHNHGMLCRVYNTDVVPSHHHFIYVT